MQNGFFISASNCASVQNGTDLTLSSNITPAEPMAAAYRSVPRPAATPKIGRASCRERV